MKEWELYLILRILCAPLRALQPLAHFPRMDSPDVQIKQEPWALLYLTAKDKCSCYMLQNWWSVTELSLNLFCDSWLFIILFTMLKICHDTIHEILLSKHTTSVIDTHEISWESSAHCVRPCSQAGNAAYCFCLPERRNIHRDRR